MSDLSSQVYDAFCKVNECQPKKLWCTWHADKAWREELKKKIGNLDVEMDVYKRLRYILELTVLRTHG